MLRWMSVLCITVVTTFMAASCSSTVDGQPNESTILTARSPIELRVVTEPGPPEPTSPTPPTSAGPGQTVLPDRNGRENHLVGPVELTLSRFTRADSSASPTGGFVVTIGLLSEDAAKFGALTEKYVGRRLAMVIDGEVVTAPTIQAAIPGGQVDISGNFTRAEADELARRLSGR